MSVNDICQVYPNQAIPCLEKNTVFFLKVSLIAESDRGGFSEQIGCWRCEDRLSLRYPSAMYSSILLGAWDYRSASTVQVLE